MNVEKLSEESNRLVKLEKRLRSIELYFLKDAPHRLQYKHKAVVLAMTQSFAGGFPHMETIEEIEVDIDEKYFNDAMLSRKGDIENMIKACKQRIKGLVNEQRTKKKSRKRSTKQ